ncbi:MAG: SDR family oxidoreductase [Candidatus Melainabacteria bacterium]|nr:SDR family oxidoreductase [Candidatus Melainabacteria bacterium]
MSLARSLRDRVAVVTGAGSGIGRATAIAFGQCGAAVIAVDIDPGGLYETARAIDSCASVEADIADPETGARVLAAARELGPITDLFNNAGAELVAPLHETSDSDWDRIMAVNLKGTFMLTRACLQAMLDTGYGSIIINASDAGMRGIRLSAAYSTSKAALVHFTRSIALDYGRFGIRANCICPGCIATPLCERFNKEVGARRGISGKEALDEFVMANIPMERVGQPEEVASVVVFLASDQARYVSGAVIPIDGGLTAGM